MMNNDTPRSLDPCPKCGGEAIYLWGLDATTTVGCGRCGLRVRTLDENPREAWNRVAAEHKTPATPADDASGETGGAEMKRPREPQWQEPEQPCPICRSTNLDMRRHMQVAATDFRAVTCKDCGCSADSLVWNRRTPGPATAKMLEMVGRHLALMKKASSRTQADYAEQMKTEEAFIAEWEPPA